MLQHIRDLTASWLALVVLGLLCIPFIFLGANLYFGEPPNPLVARIGERELGQDAFRSAADRYRRELGANELSVSIRNEALERMIDGGLILEYTKSRRMQIADKLLGEEIEGLFGGEEFDLEEYQVWLSQQRLTEPAFENQVRLDMLSRQLQDAVTGSVFLLNDELRRLARSELQQRDFAYVRIGMDEEAVEEPEADTIREHYNAHPEDYTLPERVRVVYLELTTEKVAQQLTVDEEELRGFYENRAADYDTEEERKLTVLHLPIPEGDPDREVTGIFMQRLLARAETGETLEKLVEEADTETAETGTDTNTDADTSTDATTNENGEEDEQSTTEAVANTDTETAEDEELPLGKERELMGKLELVSRDFVTRNALPADQAEALFALEEETALSTVLEDTAGVRILRLDEIKEGRVSTFENSSDDAERDYRELEAERRFIEQAERLGVLAFESPGSLEPAATALALEIHESAPFPADRGEPGEISAEAAVRAAAFSEAVLEAEENSDLLELGDDRVVVLRLLEHIPESVQPLEEVEEQVIMALKRTLAINTASERGAAALQRLQAGAGRGEVATELDLEWEEHEDVTRDNRELLRAALREAFHMAVAKPGTFPVYSGSKLGNGDYLLVALEAVHDVDDDTEITQDKLDELSERLSSARYLLEWREFLQQARGLYDVEVYDEQVEKTWPEL